MWITTDEAVEMYARFLMARHGRMASKLARDKAGSLQSKGDDGGHKIWNEVADVVDRDTKSRTRQESVTSAS